MSSGSDISETKVSLLTKQIFKLKSEIASNYSLLAERDVVIQDLRARANVIVAINNQDKFEWSSYNLSSNDDFTYTFETAEKTRYKIAVAYVDGTAITGFTFEDGKLTIPRSSMTDSITIIIEAIKQWQITIDDQGSKQELTVDEGYELIYPINDYNTNRVYYVNEEIYDRQIITKTIREDTTIIIESFAKVTGLVSITTDDKISTQQIETSTHDETYVYQIANYDTSAYSYSVEGGEFDDVKGTVKVSTAAEINIKIVIKSIFKVSIYQTTMTSDTVEYDKTYDFEADVDAVVSCYDSHGNPVSVNREDVRCSIVGVKSNIAIIIKDPVETTDVDCLVVDQGEIFRETKKLNDSFTYEVKGFDSDCKYVTTAYMKGEAIAVEINDGKLEIPHLTGDLFVTIRRLIPFYVNGEFEKYVNVLEMVGYNVKNYDSEKNKYTWSIAMNGEEQPSVLGNFVHDEFVMLGKVFGDHPSEARKLELTLTATPIVYVSIFLNGRVIDDKARSGKEYNLTEFFDFKKQIYNIEIKSGDAELRRGIDYNCSNDENTDDERLGEIFIQIFAETIKSDNIYIVITPTNKINVKVNEEDNYVLPEKQTFTYTFGPAEEGKHYYITYNGKRYKDGEQDDNLAFNYPYANVPLTGEETEVQLTVETVNYYTVTVKFADVETILDQEAVDEGESFTYHITPFEHEIYHYYYGEKYLEFGILVIPEVTGDMTIEITRVPLYKFTVYVDGNLETTSDSYESGKEVNGTVTKTNEEHPEYQYEFALVGEVPAAAENWEFVDPVFSFNIMGNVELRFTSKQYWNIEISCDSPEISENKKAYVDDEVFEYELKQPTEMTVYTVEVKIGNEVINKLDFDDQTNKLSIPMSEITNNGTVKFTSHAAVTFTVKLDGNIHTTKLVQKSAELVYEFVDAENIKDYTVKVMVGSFTALESQYIWTKEENYYLFTMEAKYIITDITLSITSINLYQLIVNDVVQEDVRLSGGIDFKYNIENYNTNKFYSLVVRRRNDGNDPWTILEQKEAGTGDYDFIVSTIDGETSASIVIFGDAIKGDISIAITEYNKQFVFVSVNGVAQDLAEQPHYIRGDQDYQIDIRKLIPVYDEEMQTFTACNVFVKDEPFTNFDFVYQTGIFTIKQEFTSTISGSISVNVEYNSVPIDVTMIVNGVDIVLPEYHYGDSFNHYVDGYKDSEVASWELHVYSEGVEQKDIKISSSGYIAVKPLTIPLFIVVKQNKVKLEYGFHNAMWSTPDQANTIEVPYGCNYTLPFPATTNVSEFLYKLVQDGKVTHGTTDDLKSFTFTAEQMKMNMQATFFLEDATEDGEYNILIHDRDHVEMMQADDTQDYTIENANEMNILLVTLDENNTPVEYTQEDNIITIPVTENGVFVSVTPKHVETNTIQINDCDVKTVVEVDTSLQEFIYSIGSAGGASEFDPDNADNYAVTVTENGIPIASNNSTWYQVMDLVSGKFTGQIKVMQSVFNKENVFIDIRMSYSVTGLFEGSAMSGTVNKAINGENYDLNLGDAIGRSYNENYELQAVVTIGDNIYTTDNSSSETVQISKAEDGYHLYINKNIINNNIKIDVSYAYTFTINKYADAAVEVKFNPYRENTDFVYEIRPFFKRGASTFNAITKCVVMRNETELTDGVTISIPNESLIIAANQITDNFTVTITATFNVSLIINGEQVTPIPTINYGTPFEWLEIPEDTTIIINDRSHQFTEDEYVREGTKLIIPATNIVSDLSIVIYKVSLEDEEEEEEIPEFNTAISIFEFGVITTTVANLFKEDPYVYEFHEVYKTGDYAIKIFADGQELNNDDEKFFDISNQEAGKKPIMTFHQLSSDEDKYYYETLRIEITFTYTIDINGNVSEPKSYNNQKNLEIDTDVYLESYDVKVKVDDNEITEGIIADGKKLTIRSGCLSGNVAITLTEITFAINHDEIKEPKAVTVEDAGDSAGDNKLENVGSISYVAANEKYVYNKAEYIVHGKVILENLVQWRYEAGGEFAYWVGLNISDTVPSEYAIYWDNEDEIFKDYDGNDDYFVNLNVNNLNKKLTIAYKYIEDDKEDVVVKYIMAIEGTYIPCSIVRFIQRLNNTDTELKFDRNIIIQGRKFTSTIENYTVNKYTKFDVYMNGKPNASVTANDIMFDSDNGVLTIPAIPTLTGIIKIIGYARNLEKFHVNYTSADPTAYSVTAIDEQQTVDEGATTIKASFTIKVDDEEIKEANSVTITDGTIDDVEATYNNENSAWEAELTVAAVSANVQLTVTYTGPIDINVDNIDDKMTALFTAFYNKSNDFSGASHTYENFDDFAAKSDVDKTADELKGIWYLSTTLPDDVDSVTEITIHNTQFTSSSLTDFSIGMNNRLKVPLWEFEADTHTLLFSVAVTTTLTEPFVIDGTLYKFTFSPDITELTPSLDYVVRGVSWVASGAVTESTTEGVDYDITLTVDETTKDTATTCNAGIEVKPNGQVVDDSQGNNYCVTKKITNGVLSFGVTDFDPQNGKTKTDAILLMYMPGYSSKYSTSKDEYEAGVKFDYTYYWFNHGIGHFSSIIKLASE